MPASYLTPHAFCSGWSCSFSHRSHQKLPCQGWKTWNPSRLRPNVVAMFFLVSSGEITRWRLAATAASVSISFVSVCILWILDEQSTFWCILVLCQDQQEKIQYVKEQRSTLAEKKCSCKHSSCSRKEYIMQLDVRFAFSFLVKLDIPIASTCKAPYKLMKYLQYCQCVFSFSCRVFVC